MLPEPQHLDLELQVRVLSNLQFPPPGTGGMRDPAPRDPYAKFAGQITVTTSPKVNFWITSSQH